MSAKPGRLLGLDGGGTKTAALLCDTDGHILAYAVGAGSNPNSVTAEVMDEVIQGLLQKLLQKNAGCGIAACFGGFGGAGAATNHARLLASVTRGLAAVAHGPVDIGSDARGALGSGIGAENGAVVICGTGSCVMLRIDGVYHRSGGWGHLLGDEGSGYDLGRRALASALRAFDGSGNETALSGLCERRLGGPVQEAVPAIYSGGRSLIASYARELLDAAAAGDRVAVQQLDEALRPLCDMVRCSCARLGAGERKLVLAGSLWRSAYYKACFAERLGAGYALIQPTLPPVYGCLIEAARLAGLSLSTDFAANFTRDWEACEHGREE